MKSIRQRSFLDLWQLLYHDSKPGTDAALWSVDGVDWSQEVHSHRGADYSFRIETHRLRARPETQAQRTLLVVTEQWWSGEQSSALKYHRWIQITEGQQRHVLDWFSRQRTRLEASLDAQSD